VRKLKKDYARLQMEHDILKKAIAFTSALRAESSPSSSTVKARTRSE
jgi:transposase